MTYQHNSTLALCAAAAGFLAASTPLRGDDAADLKRQVELLQQQNAVLLEQVRQQQTVIDALGRRVGDIEKASAQRTQELDDLKADVKEAGAAAKPPGGFNLGKVNVSGEGGVAFFNSGSDGMFPNSEFRVDEAKLFVEAPVWEDVYFFGEVNFATRESDELDLKLGELYVDFESISKLWDRESTLNLRAGRFDIPFGEEYLTRDAIDNPLISHSLSDLWGVDEGVELYGSVGKFSYVAAVQNGGVPGAHDYDGDKAVVGRLSFDPTKWLHLSVSGMRTGNLDAEDDYLSELWFGGGWFRSIGSPATTRFHANLVEGNVGLQFSRGHLKAFGGYVDYDDNDPAADNQRDLWYYSVEGVYDVTRQFYAAARYSQIFADKGYPLPGNGNMGDYYFTPTAANWAENLWRLSLGLGYHFSERLLLKAEYTFEGGRDVGGEGRDHEDFLGTEVAFKF